MNGDITVLVDCILRGAIVRKYDYLVPGTVGAPAVPRDDDYYRSIAKEDLATERLAAPPFEGFEFNVRRVPHSRA